MTTSVDKYLEKYPHARSSSIIQRQREHAKTEQLKAEIRTSKKTFVERLMENVADLRNLIGWQ